MTWSSSNTAVATVSTSGVVAGITAGQTTIKATATDGSGVAGSKTITVTQPVTAVTVNGPATVFTGKTVTLTAAITPTNATTKAVTWSSSNTAVATVSTSGVVTGVVAGKATIKATATDGSGIVGNKEITITRPASAITINGTASVFIGKTITLTPVVSPTSATTQTVTWSSDNTAVATVNTSGVVTGIATGQATIKATATDGSGITGSKTISVTQPVASIAISGLTAVQVDRTITLVATASPASADNKGVAWTSSNTAIATVTSTGVVKGAKVGIAVIKAIAADGSGTIATQTITVTAKTPVTSVTIIGTSTISTGKTIQLKAVAAPATALQTIKWTSSSTAKATVNTTGLVKCLKTGTTIITATATDGTGKYASKTITVTVPVTSVAISGASTIAFGKTITLTAKTLPSGSNQTVKWSSGSTAIATVTSSGVVTGKKVGIVVIKTTATDGTGKYSSKTVKITTPVTSIAINGTSTVAAGKTIKLTAKVLPAAANQTVKWTSSSTAIATVTSAGIIKGVKAGSVVIKATATDGTGKYSSKIIKVTGTTSAKTVSLTSAFETTPASNLTAGSKMTTTTNLYKNDGAVIKAFNDVSYLEFRDGQLYLPDATVQKAAETRGVSYDGVYALPIFKATDANMKSGDVAEAIFDISGDKFTSGETIATSETKVLKVFEDGKGKLFGYARDTASAKDQTYLILDAEGNAVETIDATNSYKLAVYVADNGAFDLDKEDEGIVVDPVAVLKVAAGTTNGMSTVTAATPDISDSSTGSGGCNAGFGILALFALPIVWRKKR